MSTLVDIRTIAVQNVTVDEDKLSVDLTDGRTVSVPLAWYPRLFYGTPKERNNWRLIGDGEGIHWPDLDEDISVESLVLGRRSGESQRSLKKWLEERAARKGQVYVRSQTHPARQRRTNSLAKSRG
jgi:hypothetical protein